MRKALKIFVVVGLGMLAGCVSPETRIKRNPQLFAQLTPQQQGLVRGGRIEIGFTRDMVRLALGEPADVQEQYSYPPSGAPVLESESWYYTAGEPSDWGHSDLSRISWGHNGYFGDFDTRVNAAKVSGRSWSRMYITFREGRVVWFAQG